MASIGTAANAQQGPALGGPKRPATPAQSAAQMAERANQNTVTIVSGTPAGTYLTVAYDMSAVLDSGDDLRVLAVAGKGSLQNVNDILHLKGVDMGIVQSDTLTHLKQTGELGTNIEQRLVYITKLYNEEMHIVAGPGIESLQDLNGKKVNFSDAGGGTELSTRIVFELLGIKVEKVNMGQADALVKVKSGEIAATVFVAGRPAAALAKLPKDPDLRILQIPYTQALEDASYLPATVTSQDYPGLIPEGQSVETIAVGAVLAVYNWPRNSDRYRRVANFIDALFSKFAEFQKPPRHPKWKEVNLAANLKGWQRFPAAQEWLDRVASQSAPVPGRVDATLARQQAARAAPNNVAEQERLFQQFLEWSKAQQKQ
jgi:TRAP transporter TAXI family solute receptor